MPLLDLLFINDEPPHAIGTREHLSLVLGIQIIAPFLDVSDTWGLGFSVSCRIVWDILSPFADLKMSCLLPISSG